MKRMFHPTLSSFEDVPDDQVDSWADAGWLKNPSKKVEYGDLPPVGEHPGIARVPVLEDVSVTTTTAGGTTVSGVTTTT